MPAFEDPAFGDPTFEETVRRRRSVRGFTSEHVPRAAIEHALELAQLCPSNCNAQPWRVTIAVGERCDRLRGRLVEAFDAEYPPSENPTPKFEHEYRARQIACAVELYTQMGVARHDKLARRRAERRNFELFDAPAVAIVCMQKSFGVGVAVDVGCYIQTFMLALTAQGIASCPQAALRCYPDVIHDELGVGDDLQILCGISFGYEDPNVPANRATPGRASIHECCTLLGFD